MENVYVHVVGRLLEASLTKVQSGECMEPLTRIQLELERLHLNYFLTHPMVQ